MRAFKNFWSESTNSVEDGIKNVFKANSIYTIMDSSGRIEYANENFCKIYRSSTGPIVGEPNHLLKTEFFSLEKHNDLWRTIMQGEKWEGVLKDVLSNGSPIWLDTKILPIKVGALPDCKFICIHEDITKIKLECEVLKNDESIYQLIYKSIKIGIVVVTDYKGSIIKWNKGAENAFGYSEHEIMGKQHSVLMAKKYKKSNISDFLELTNRYRTIKNQEGLEFYCLNKEGSEFPVELVVSKWTINNEDYYAFKMLDITKRIAFQNMLKRKTKELELFLYRSAHDLNAPFSSAQGLINLIKEEQSIDKMQILINMLEKTINNAKALSNSLTSASLISSKVHEITVVDFSQIVDNVLKILKGYNNFENLKFNIDIENPNDFISSPDLIFAIFQNLIKNGIKFSLPLTKNHQPWIDIKVKSLRDGILIIICDNGKGINKKDLNKIFELYYRAEADQNPESNGLGLYIVKSIVESLKGEIRVESKIQNSTCFTIHLPKTN
ncbi:PAS domain S-box-containing protein [Saonia flava]|uniref:histidine kinase n=1 Tax=Saonia flava TaxID=523696 RepID=A0A846QMX1_9FLAO|nr:PAS domain-containing sensor histidine kinase [Saonia flava]NJB70366.1 PAS domain S-box-containing protein [Saonia flava]